MIIQIKSIEETATSTGKQYWKIQTDQGRMGIWEAGIYNAMKGLVNQSADVEIKTANGYKTIIKFIKAIEASYSTDKFAIGREDKTWSMRESYCKDIFLGLLAKAEKPEATELAHLAVAIENALREGTREQEEQDGNN